jgi:hypothetical protein
MHRFPNKYGGLKRFLVGAADRPSKLLSERNTAMGPRYNLDKILPLIAGLTDLDQLRNIQVKAIALATQNTEHAELVAQHAADRIKAISKPAPVPAAPYAPSSSEWNYGRAHPIGHHTVQYQVPHGRNWVVTVKQNGQFVDEAATSGTGMLWEDNGVQIAEVHFPRLDAATYYAGAKSFLVEVRGGVANEGAFHTLLRVKPRGQPVSHPWGLSLETEVIDIIDSNREHSLLTEGPAP